MKRETERGRERERQINRQTYRHTGKQRQTNRQTEKQTGVEVFCWLTCKLIVQITKGYKQTAHLITFFLLSCRDVHVFSKPLLTHGCPCPYCQMLVLNSLNIFSPIRTIYTPSKPLKLV